MLRGNHNFFSMCLIKITQLEHIAMHAIFVLDLHNKFISKIIINLSKKIIRNLYNKFISNNYNKKEL